MDRKMIKKIIEKIQKWRMDRRLKKKLKILRKRDPFIYK